MAMKAKLAVLFFLFTLVGCSSFKESVGQYVTEAVHQKVVADVDTILEKRGLSRAEIKDVIDENGDGKIDRREILETTKEATRDAVLLEAKKLVDDQIATSREGYVEKGALNSIWHEMWLAILGLISAYLGKQVYSAKQDGRRDQRIAVLEKALGRDIDGDGTIGSVGGSAGGEGEDPVVTA